MGPSISNNIDRTRIGDHWPGRRVIILVVHLLRDRRRIHRLLLRHIRVLVHPLLVSAGVAVKCLRGRLSGLMCVRIGRTVGVDGRGRRVVAIRAVLQGWRLLEVDIDSAWLVCLIGGSVLKAANVEDAIFMVLVLRGQRRQSPVLLLLRIMVFRMGHRHAPGHFHMRVVAVRSILGSIGSQATHTTTKVVPDRHHARGNGPVGTLLRPVGIVCHGQVVVPGAMRCRCCRGVFVLIVRVAHDTAAGSVIPAGVLDHGALAAKAAVMVSLGSVERKATMLVIRLGATGVSAGVWPLPRVDSTMTGQARRIREFFATSLVLAAMWFLAGVRPYVDVECTTLDEGFAAGGLLALERSSSCVDAVVSLQVGFSVEGFGALVPR